MKILSLVHPLFQCVAFLVGVANARMGLTRKNFTWERHRNWGLLYYAMAAAGLFGGLMITESLQQVGISLDLGLHLPIGVFMVLLFVLAGLLGFLIRIRPTLRKALLPVHKYLNLATLLLFLYQGFSGVSALIKVFSG